MRKRWKHSTASRSCEWFRERRTSSRKKGRWRKSRVSRGGGLPSTSGREADGESMGEFKIFGGTGSHRLAANIADELRVSLGERAITRFPDGETSVRIR